MVVKSFITHEDPTPLYEEKLASSGLTPDDGKLLGYSALPVEEVARLKHWYWDPVPALKIPYFDPFTGGPMKFLNDWPNFYRVRWLKEPQPAPPEPGKKPKKAPRYLQPKDTGMCAYFPTIGDIDWPTVLTDYTYPLIITEGELKAAATCKAGIPTIGLGGVDNFATTNNGYDFVPSLKNIVWARRVVTICYDSDLSTKPGVCRALQKLADQLMDRGALPKYVVLPQSSDGAKVGLDDFLLTRPVDDLKLLLNEQGQFITMAEALFDLNEKWSLVKSVFGLVRHETGDIVKTSDFSMLFTENTARREIRPNGQVESVMVPLGDRWLKWPLRSKIDDVTYDPAHPPLSKFEDDLGVSYFNTWKGWGTRGNLVPKKGDVSPFLDLMQYLFTGAPPEALNWMLQWCGYPIAHPGVKLRTSAIIHGIGERTGKSSIGYTLKEIYGPNFIEISQSEFGSAFNTWQIKRQFVMCDDVTGIDKQHTIDTIKRIISQKEVYVNEKNKPNYTIPDKTNFLWTSNRPATFAIADNDSRFFVHQVDVTPRPRKWWDDYYTWLRDGGGAAALFHYFLHDVSYANFNPFGDALVTTAKEEMKEASHTSAGSYVRDILRDGPEAIFVMNGQPVPGVAGRDMFTSDEITSHFEMRYPNERITSRAISNILAECGCKRAGLIDAPDGIGKRRYWIIRNAKKWATASVQDKQAHIANPLPPQKSAKVVKIRPKGEKF